MLRQLVLAALLSACGPGTVAISDGPADGPGTDTDTDEPEILDADGDGFEIGDDCDDDDPTSYPGAEELCDLIDHDCNGDPVAERICPCERLYQLDGSLYVGCESFSTFDDAVAFCEDNQMQLVIASDPGELDLVQTMARDARRPLVWVGATDRQDEGTFVWLDGTPVDSGVWNRGEPNDFFGEDCAALDSNRGGLNDIGCETPAGFACESLRRL